MRELAPSPRPLSGNVFLYGTPWGTWSGQVECGASQEANGTTGAHRVCFVALGVWRESECRSRWNGRERMGWDVLRARSCLEDSRISPEALSRVHPRSPEKAWSCGSFMRQVWESWNEKNLGALGVGGRSSQACEEAGSHHLSSKHQSSWIPPLMPQLESQGTGTSPGAWPYMRDRAVDQRLYRGRTNASLSQRVNCACAQCQVYHLPGAWGPGQWCRFRGWHGPLVLQSDFCQGSRLQHSEHTIPLHILRAKCSSWR